MCERVFFVNLQLAEVAEMLCKKVVLRNSAKFRGKHLCQRLFFNKVAGQACARDSFLIKLQVRPATLLKKSLWYRCFPVNFAKFLRTPFLQNTSGRLLLLFPHKTAHNVLVKTHITHTRTQMATQSLYKYISYIPEN